MIPLPDWRLDPPAPAVTYDCDLCHGRGYLPEEGPCDCDCHAAKPPRACAGCQETHFCVLCNGRGWV